MQPSTSFDWGRVVRALRWTARTLAILIGAIFAIWAIVSALTYGVSSWLPYVLYGLPAIGLLVVIFWTGIGEIVGGLALVGIAIWMFVAGRFDLGGLWAFGSLALAGIVLIGCGWYALVHRESSHHTPAAHTTA